VILLKYIVFIYDFCQFLYYEFKLYFIFVFKQNISYTFSYYIFISLSLKEVLKSSILLLVERNIFVERYYTFIRFFRNNTFLRISGKILQNYNICINMCLQLKIYTHYLKQKFLKL